MMSSMDPGMDLIGAARECRKNRHMAHEQEGWDWGELGFLMEKLSLPITFNTYSRIGM